VLARIGEQQTANSEPRSSDHHGQKPHQTTRRHSQDAGHRVLRLSGQVIGLDEWKLGNGEGIGGMEVEASRLVQPFWRGRHCGPAWEAEKARSRLDVVSL
jgi:hypothetical protein